MHWKTIRVVILRQFIIEINLKISQCAPILDLLTTDGRGLTRIWRVYIFRIDASTFEYNVRQIAEYQLLKKSQVFCAILTDPKIGKLLFGDTKGNIHICNNYPWEVKEDPLEDFNCTDMIKQD